MRFGFAALSHANPADNGDDRGEDAGLPSHHAGDLPLRTPVGLAPTIDRRDGREFSPGPITPLGRSWYYPGVDINELREVCLALPGTSYDFPFGPDTIVFRVAGKMFALAGIHDDPLEVNLKCEPDLARDLRVAYEAIVPGYHMNKEHWNTVRCGGDVPDDQLERLVAHSHELVVAGLPRSKRPGPT